MSHLYPFKWDQRLTGIIPPSFRLYLVSSTEWQEEAVFYPMLCHCFPHPALYSLIVLLWVTEPHLRPCVKYWQIKGERPFTQQRDGTREAAVPCLPLSDKTSNISLTWEESSTYSHYDQRLFSRPASLKWLIQKLNTWRPFKYDLRTTEKVMIIRPPLNYNKEKTF